MILLCVNVVRESVTNVKGKHSTYKEKKPAMLLECLPDPRPGYQKLFRLKADSGVDVLWPPPEETAPLCLASDSSHTSVATPRLSCTVMSLSYLGMTGNNHRMSIMLPIRKKSS